MHQRWSPAAIRAVLATMPLPPNPKLVAAEAYDLKDREIAAEVDVIAFAISVRREAGLLIAEAERNHFNRVLDLPRRASSRPCRPRSLSGSCRNVLFVTRAGEHTE
jgi:hypothetical protein